MQQFLRPLAVFCFLSELNVPEGRSDQNIKKYQHYINVRGEVLPTTRGTKTAVVISLFVCLLDSLRPLNNLSVMRDGSSWVEPVLS